MYRVCFCRTFDYVEREIPKVPHHIPILVLANHRDMGEHRTVSLDKITFYIDDVHKWDHNSCRSWKLTLSKAIIFILFWKTCLFRHVCLCVLNSKKAVDKGLARCSRNGPVYDSRLPDSRITSTDSSLTVTWFCRARLESGGSAVRCCEASMRNGFGLKYVHRFFNVPFLKLQVSSTVAIIRLSK